MEIEHGQTLLPEALSAELSKMRRNPNNFAVSGMSTCQLCGGKEKRTVHVGVEDDDDVGAWCPVHGWIYFDSVAHPPTERLTASEIEDHRLDQRRAAEWQLRQKRKET